jgi:hypothetical protein
VRGTGSVRYALYVAVVYFNTKRLRSRGK